jgi:hypothetical protein
VEKWTEESSRMVIGRSKIILVNDSSAGSPVGIVSEVVALRSSDAKEGRLVFRGPVKFKEASKNHLSSIVLPLVDRITDSLSLPRGNYEVSIVNIGAAAFSGLGIEIGGFSADLPVFLALLSSSIQVPLRADIASTGHIGSLDGDIVAVRGIPAKLDAALQSPGIRGFAIPELEKDTSLKLLTPLEYHAAVDSLLAHKGKIKIYPIKDIHDALKIFMTDESIVTGGLKAGFFDRNPVTATPESPVNKASFFLSAGNEKRFWETLEVFLLNRDIEKAKLLLRAYAGYFIQNGRYPENFGEALFRLVLSLPPLTRRLEDLFPLLPTELCIKLSQHAGSAADQDDVRQVYKAAFGEGLKSPSRSGEASTSNIMSSGEEEILERILSEISEESLTEKFGIPLDSARLCYLPESVTVKDGFEFNEAITAFYAHMFRHTGSPTGQMKKDAVSSEAFDLVENAFERKGGYKSALSEGMHAVNGGMRLVFDAMTESLKLKRKEDYINMVLKTTMDALDWDSKVRLMKVFMKRIGAELPADLRDLPPDRLEPHWEEIIRYFAESISKVKGLLRRL